MLRQAVLIPATQLAFLLSLPETAQHLSCETVFYYTLSVNDLRIIQIRVSTATLDVSLHSKL